MQALIHPLTELADYEEIEKKKQKEPGTIRILGCVNSQKTHMMYGFAGEIRYKVIICPSESRARQVYEEYRFLDGSTYLYPAKDLLFYQADLRSRELVSRRMEVLEAVIEGEPLTVVTSFDALMDSLLPRETIQAQTIKIRYDSPLNLTEMEKKLTDLGYERAVQIDGPGQFAVRGGILDVFPLTEEMPVRIELWGDEVDSVRTFDVESQRSVENLEEVSICPAAEFPGEGERGVSFLDYFDPGETLLFLDEPVRLLEKGQGVEEEFMEAQKQRVESGYEVKDGEVRLFPAEEVIKKINTYSSLGFYALDMRCKGLLTRGSYHIQAKNVNPYNSSFELLTRDLKRLKKNGSRVVLLSGSRTRAKRLAEG